MLKPSLFCTSFHEPIMEENEIFVWPYSGVKEHTKSELVLNGCFYLFMSMADQLKCILECFGLGKHIKCIWGKNNHGNVVSDVSYDGLIMYAQYIERRKGQYGTFDPLVDPPMSDQFLND